MVATTTPRKREPNWTPGSQQPHKSARSALPVLVDIGLTPHIIPNYHSVVIAIGHRSPILGVMQIPQELCAIVEQQDGLVTRQQILANDISVASLRHVVDRGYWQRILRGVYATFTGPLQERHRVRAALLYAGPESLVTGSFACNAYGMKYVRETASIDLLVPPSVRRVPISIANSASIRNMNGKTRAEQPVAIRRVKTMPLRRNVRGIPCASPERAVLDAVRGDDNLRSTRAALCEVIQRGLATTQRLLDEYQHVDPRGLTLVRYTLDDVTAGCRSAPECELRDLIRACGLREPLWNQPLPDANDLIPDAQFPDSRLVLEVDSVEWHHFGDAPDRTERKRARYASLGWRVLPIAPRRIREEPQVVAAEIRKAIGY